MFVGIEKHYLCISILENWGRPYFLLHVTLQVSVPNYFISAGDASGLIATGVLADNDLKVR